MVRAGSPCGGLGPPARVGVESRGRPEAQVILPGDLALRRPLFPLGAASGRVPAWRHACGPVTMAAEPARSVCEGCSHAIWPVARAGLVVRLRYLPLLLERGFAPPLMTAGRRFHQNNSHRSLHPYLEASHVPRC